MSVKRGTILLLVVVGFLTYAPTLRNQLFWDDDDNIVKNVYIKDFRYLPQLFTRSQIEGSLGQVSNQYRPLLMLVFAIEYHLWGLWAPGYHLVNVLLHVINGILVYTFIKFLLRISHFSNAPALLAALLFLLHPIQTEAVAYVAGRTDLLATFFLLLGLLIFLSKRIMNHELRIKHAGQRPLSLLLVYIFALVSKETAIVFPLLLFITDYFFFTHSVLRTLFSRLRLWLSLSAVAITYVFLRLTILNFHNTLNFYGGDNIFTGNIVYRVLTFFHALTIYTQLLIAPIHLHAERIIPIATNLINLPVLLGLLLTLLSFTLIIVGIRRIMNQESRIKAKQPTTHNLELKTIIAFGALWFWITIFLSSNIPVPINSLLAEHFLYTPSVGLFFAIAMAIVTLYSKLFPYINMGGAKVVLLFLLFSLFSLRSILRNREWHDPIIFYEQTLSFVPESARVRNNLAMNYADLGQHAKAIQHYRLAIQTTDRYPQTHYNLGNSLVAIGSTPEAIKEYERAISLDQSFFPSYTKLIPLYLLQGKKDQAAQLLLLLKKRGVISDAEIQRLLESK